MLRLCQCLGRPWFLYVVIAMGSLLVWGHTVGYNFVWDDRQFIQESPSIRSLSNVPQMFVSLKAQSSYPEGFKLFRPLRTAFYACLFWMGGKESPQPWLYHLSNLLWHTAVALLLFSVGRLLFQKTLPDASEAQARALAFGVGLAFAVHPVVSEVVCWAKSLDDSMAAFFTLLAMRSLLTLKDQGDAPTLGQRGYWLALLWFLLAVYSKISAVPFALVAFLIFFQLRRLGLRRACALTAGFLGIALLFMVHRHLVIGQSNQTAPISGSYIQTLVDMFPVGPHYLRLLCGIPPYCIDYSFLPGHQGLLSPGVLAGIALLLIIVLVIWWAQRRSETRLVVFSLLWAGLFLLPVSNLLPMMQYMAERFLYLPLIGWLWGLSFLLWRLRGWRGQGALAGVVITIWAGLAWHRSHIWQDEVTLFVQSYQQGPRTKRVAENAVAAIFQLPHVRAMFTLDAKQQTLFVNNVSQEERSAAGRTLAEAYRMFPEDENVCAALAIFYAQSGQLDKAMGLFETAARKQPQNPKHWLNLARVHLDMGNTLQAGKLLRQAKELSPENPELVRLQVRLLWQQQDYPGTLKALLRLKEMEPNDPEIDRWIKDTREKMNP